MSRDPRGVVVCGRTRRVVACGVLGALLAVAAPAAAEQSEVVTGRAVLVASYGLVIAFYQHEQFSASSPGIGHGLFLRLGGERCGAVCFGASGLGAMAASPWGAGWVGVGPHFGLVRARRAGATFGPIVFRIGATYDYLWAPRPEFADSGLEWTGTWEGTETGHGVGGWLEVTSDVLARSLPIAPTIGLRVQYVASLTTDPIGHLLCAELVIGLGVSRRLQFGEPTPEEEEPAAGSGDRPQDAGEEDDEEDDERLREGEDALREW